MIKKLMWVSVLALSLVNYSHATCPTAAPNTTPEFCESFKSVAKCHCMASGLSDGMCSDMNTLYQRMLVVFRSLERACNYQQNTSPQDCIDSWNCYRHGGVTSTGQLCSSSGAACA